MLESEIKVKGLRLGQPILNNNNKMMIMIKRSKKPNLKVKINLKSIDIHKWIYENWGSFENSIKGIEEIEFFSEVNS